MDQNVVTKKICSIPSGKRRKLAVESYRLSKQACEALLLCLTVPTGQRGRQHATRNTQLKRGFRLVKSVLLLGALTGNNHGQEKDGDAHTARSVGVQARKARRGRMGARRWKGTVCYAVLHGGNKRADGRGR